MPRSTGRKLAIFAAISDCFIYAEAKYCAFEIHGEPKYYVCPRTEYCCNFGCCVSPGFQIYHLWYYWFLVIIMFLVCSGGGWWYRYWLQGRYRAAASAIPSRTSGSRAQTTLRGSACQPQQARVTYNPARNTVLLHRMWKGPQRSATPPAYNSAVASSTHLQNTNVVLNDNNCPYYQLYGPPPSYETVIAQTRGKILSPTSPEHPGSNSQTSNAQSQSLVQCFAHPYSPPSRLQNSTIEGTQYQSSVTNLDHVESYGGIGFARFVPSYSSERDLKLETCMPSELSRQSTIGSSNRPHQNVPSRCTTFKADEASSNRSDRRHTLQNSTSSPDRFTAMSIESTNGSGEAIRNDLFETEIRQRDSTGQMHEMERPYSSQRATSPVTDLRTAQAALSSDDDSHPRVGARISRIPKMFAYAHIDGSVQTSGQKEDGEAPHGAGSLKRSHNERIHCVDTYRYEHVKDDESKEQLVCMKRSTQGIRKLSAVGTQQTAQTSKSTNCYDSDRTVSTAQNSSGASEPNPSNNVILPPSISTTLNNFSRPINIIENIQHYVPTSARQTRAEPTSECEHKLDRSKSLD